MTGVYYCNTVRTTSANTHTALHPFSTVTLRHVDLKKLWKYAC